MDFWYSNLWDKNVFEAVKFVVICYTPIKNEYTEINLLLSQRYILNLETLVPEET
jgi:hypothetical protein